MALGHVQSGDRVIAALRRDLAELVRVAVPDLPVWEVLPEDVPQVPCAVIGRPSLVPDPDITTGVLASTVVTVVGRRYTAEEPQTELDDTTWSVLAAFNYFGGLRSSNFQRLVVSAVDPDLVAIAADEYPVYRITTDSHVVAC
jgi:hypothetical protein